MRLERFGAYEFGIYNPQDRLGGGVANAPLIRTAAGAFDPLGTDTVRTGEYQIVKRMVFMESTAAALQTQLDAVRALRGKRDTLYMRLADESVRSAYGRCVQVVIDRNTDNWLHQPVELVFECLATEWVGAPHTASGWVLDAGVDLDTGYELDEAGTAETMASSPHTMTGVSNDGNQYVYDAVVTVTAGGADITALTIENTTNGLTNISFTGTVAAGEVLVIDAGLMAVTNDGADAYASFAVNSGHKMGGWLRLDPGTNAVKCTFTGGSTDSTISVAFRDGWA